MEHFTFCLVTMTYASMPFPGCDELILIPIMYFVCILHGHSSYLPVCNFFGLLLCFKDSLPSYKNLVHKIDLNFCWIMFFEAFKLRIELGKIRNKFILDLDKFQVNFLLEDFNFYF